MTARSLQWASRSQENQRDHRGEEEMKSLSLDLMD